MCSVQYVPRRSICYKRLQLLSGRNAQADAMSRCVAKSEPAMSWVQNVIQLAAFISDVILSRGDIQMNQAEITPRVALYHSHEAKGVPTPLAVLYY